MVRIRTVYLPLTTYPEPADPAALQATLGCLASMACSIDAMAFAVDLPSASSGLGDYLVSIPGIIQAAEKKSRDGCEAMKSAILQSEHAFMGEPGFVVRDTPLGSEGEVAAAAARYYDLAAVPWSPATAVSTDLIHSLVFDSGRPVLLVPSTARGGRVTTLAVAWDGSRVAARALADALPLLEDDGLIVVLSVEGDKKLDANIAQRLAVRLEKRGYRAIWVNRTLHERGIAQTLQDMATEKDVQLLAMGGFGHSRLRDFILGGATKGVLADLRLPVLLSH
jgi:nucleotide-binding universal stress UspA family protein